jgi:hypothetical protein
MGAEQFITTAEGATADEAFDAARKEALYEHGHRGYSGTIAEKEGFTTFEVPALASADEAMARVYARAVLSGQFERGEGDEEMRRIGEAVDGKWGPAGHIPLAGKRHLFFGWASS